MRLINTSTGLFEEFLGRNTPKYAILSHTWEDDEVSYKDMENNNAASKKGYQKIKMTCQLAREAGLNYAWVDTCCIDKSSSAELSEAINSMFRWYHRSEVCFAYLSDLPTTTAIRDVWQDCRWFRRSWTLQELIAPINILFLDEKWIVRGSKNELVDSLSTITGIRAEILRHERLLSSISVAAKMSWAANRECTRVEDMAYSLLGIFDLNMPLLYGEEEKAFTRLQEEIIRSIGDLSIFAWSLPTAAPGATISGDHNVCGVLADSPTAFAKCRDLVRGFHHARQELSISNVGVRVSVQQLASEWDYILPLYCSLDSKRSLAIPLTTWGVGQFVRRNPQILVHYSTEQVASDAPKEGYLLTRLPEHLVRTSTQIARPSLPIAQVRSHVLEITLQKDMEVYDRDVWSSSRCDMNYERFFAVGDDSVRDYATLKVKVQYSRRRRHAYAFGEFECVFYALGWSSPNRNHLQCSLVDMRKSLDSISKAQSEIAAWDHDTTQVLEILVRNKVPKSSMIVLNDPSQKVDVYVWFEPKLVNNQAICPNPYWRIELSVGYPWKGAIPEMPRRLEEWRLQNGSVMLNEQAETAKSAERFRQTEPLDRGKPPTDKSHTLTRLQRLWTFGSKSARDRVMR